MKKQDNMLTGAIAFAGVAIAASIVFFATQLGGSTNLNSTAFENRVEEIVDGYLVKVINREIVPGMDITTIDDDDAFLGDKDAPITIVEFSDYECPFCKSFYTDTLPELKSEYIDTGKVKLVYRDFPLNSHANALPAAIAAECAREQGGDEVYFDFHDMIFTNSSRPTRDVLITYAGNVGVDVDKFTKCLDDEKYIDEVQADLSDGASLGVTGTPAFFVNGQLLEGAQPFEAFEQVIEQELKK